MCCFAPESVCQELIEGREEGKEGWMGSNNVVFQMMKTILQQNEVLWPLITNI